MTDNQIHSYLAASNLAGVIAIALFLAAVSAYIALAYLVGAKLTRMQNYTISILFVSFGLFFAWGTFGYFSRADYFYNLLAVKPPGINATGAVPFIVGGAQLAGIVVCLKFMRDKRSTANDLNVFR